MNIIGASGHAKVIIDILELQKVDITGIWDDNEDLLEFNTLRVNGNISSFLNLNNAESIIAIGNNRVRKIIANKLDSKFGCVIHPKSVIAKSTKMLEGVVIMANVTVNSDVLIGKHVILNTNASIDHDCKIGDFVHVSPQVGLAGNVEIGEGTHIGIGANVIQGIKIGKWATIGAGTVVIRDIPDYAVVVGNPGTIIKYNSIYN